MASSALRTILGTSNESQGREDEPVTEEGAQPVGDATEVSRSSTMPVRWAHLLFFDGVWLRRSAFYV